MALSLRTYGLEKALYEHWFDPRYDETLALLASLTIVESNASNVESIFIRFVEWGQAKAKSDPLYLAKEARRSPLQVTMHVVSRAEMAVHTFPELTRHLIERARSSPRRAYKVASDKRTPPGVLAGLAQMGGLAERVEVSLNPSTPVEALAILARDKKLVVRVSAAENPNMAVETLTSLAGDNNRMVRHAVASNPSTPFEVLTNLATDMFVQWSVAQNRNTPRDILQELAGSAQPEVREQVARNENTPIEVLTRLAEDEDPDVRVAVARNENTPIEVLTKLAKDEDREVRHAVAFNSNTPVVTLMELATDSHVRWSVAKNPNAPGEILKELKGADGYSMEQLEAMPMWQEFDENSYKHQKSQFGCYLPTWEDVWALGASLDFASDKQTSSTLGINQGVLEKDVRAQVAQDCRDILEFL